MKKSLIAAALAATFITGCSEPQTTKTEQVAAVAEKPQATEQAELGTFGVDLTARNEAVKPGDDFFMYASGSWYDNYEMPADKTRYGAFSALAERSEERVKEIIEDMNDRDSRTEQMKDDLELVAHALNSKFIGQDYMKEAVNDLAALSFVSIYFPKVLEKRESS